jgi:hypothetical protein
MLYCAVPCHAVPETAPFVLKASSQYVFISVSEVLSSDDDEIDETNQQYLEQLERSLAKRVPPGSQFNVTSYIRVWSGITFLEDIAKLDAVNNFSSVSEIEIKLSCLCRYTDYFEVFLAMHFHILDVSSITPIKCALYIKHISKPCFCYMLRCISHHLRKNLSISYSKPSAFTKLLSVVRWLCNKI